MPDHEAPAGWLGTCKFRWRFLCYHKDIQGPSFGSIFIMTCHRLWTVETATGIYPIPFLAMTSVYKVQDFNSCAPALLCFFHNGCRATLPEAWGTTLWLRLGVLWWDSGSGRNCLDQQKSASKLPCQALARTKGWHWARSFWGTQIISYSQCTSHWSVASEFAGFKANNLNRQICSNLVVTVRGHAYSEGVPYVPDASLQAKGLGTTTNTIVQQAPLQHVEKIVQVSSSHWYLGGDGCWASKAQDRAWV